MKNLHFICIGNTYRSRLAEAYFNSLHVKGWQAISSGVEAKHNLNGPITTYASYILERENISSFTNPSWTQTNQENLSKADHVVFMENNVYKICHDILQLSIPNFEIWKVADIDPNGITQKEMNTIAEKTFLDIKKNVNQLIVLITN